MAKKQVKKSNVGGAVVVGASVAALTAAAYAMFGPEGDKNRKAIKGWLAEKKVMGEKELKSLENEARAHWNKLAKDAKPAIKQIKKVQKAVVKKVQAKKAVAKAVVKVVKKGK